MESQETKKLLIIYRAKIPFATFDDWVKFGPESSIFNPNTKPTNIRPLRILELKFLDLEILGSNLVPFLWFGLWLE